MERNRFKRTIYLKTFTALLATYLVLMLGFSAFFIAQEKKKAVMELENFALYINNKVERILQEHTDPEQKITDLKKLNKELLLDIDYFDTEAALYTGDYDLLFHTDDYWLCSYTERIEGNTRYIGYGYLQLQDWFEEKEVEELENYFYAEPQAKKIGDLSGYYLDLEGFWLDQGRIIPEKIRVIPMYASAFDEKGEVTSENWDEENSIYYQAKLQNVDTEELPYFESGHIILTEDDSLSKDKRQALRAMVLDGARLKASVADLLNRVENAAERVGFLTYCLYWAQPYQNQAEILEDESIYSPYWLALAREVNLWHKSAGILAFVWASCLLAFLLVAGLLSAQSYRTYQEREELAKQRQETTRALAHDLKTPLSIISGYAQNLLENIHTEKKEQYALGILNNVQRMDRILGEMLEFAKADFTGKQLNLEEVSLREICAGIMERYEKICSEQEIAVYLKGEATIKADPVLIERVVDNFFVNALDHTPQGGLIRMEIGDDIFELYNSGSHIPEDKLQEIWQPYKKGDASRGRTKGTGLGLSIARAILEAHGFSYGAKNRDQGVIFWFKFRQG